MHALSNSGIIDQNDAAAHRNYAIRNRTTNLNTSEQHGLMGQNDNASEQNNDDEFVDSQTSKAKNRKAQIADAINEADEDSKKKTFKRTRTLVKKKKKKGKKASEPGIDLL